MKPGDTNVHLYASSSTVTCPGQKLSIDNKTGKVTIEEKPPIKIPLSVIRINDIAFAGIAGDVAAEIGMNIRANLPVSNTMLVTNTAGFVGYILSDASYKKPGHGLTKSALKPGYAEKAIIGGLNDLLNGDQ